MNYAMIEVKTSDLIGRALDYAVAVVEGHPLCEECCSGTYALIIGTGRGDLKEFSPSTDWSHGGPLIEKHMLRVKPHVSTNGVITSWVADMTWPCATMPGRCGKTPLIAACRAIVMKELGAVVSVPKELMP